MRIENVVINRDLLFYTPWAELFHYPEENDMSLINLALTRPHAHYVLDDTGKCIKDLGPHPRIDLLPSLGHCLGRHDRLSICKASDHKPLMGQ